MQEIQILQPNVNICPLLPVMHVCPGRMLLKKIFFGSVILIIQLADEVQDSIAL